MKVSRSLQLDSSSQVAVIGGGPAGSLFTLFFLRFARERGISPAITIYEPKDFSQAGPVACNRSAGILSASFLSDLHHGSLSVPENVVQQRIFNYQLHSPFGTVSLTNPEPEEIPLVVFRGGGPVHNQGETICSFDGYLLELARGSGATVVNKRVSEVKIRPRPTVVVDGDNTEYDLIVLACGVNSLTPLVSGTAYRRPETCLMVQDELFAGRDVVESKLDGTVHIFFLPGSSLVFGSLVPKGAFINVSLLAAGCQTPSVEDFLNNRVVRQVLNFPFLRSCGCRGLAGIRPATGAADDGFVAIGDASVSRLYKDGLGSALKTARQAALTAVHHGISRQAFERHYLPLCRSIALDNRFGNFIFQFHQRAKDSATFLKAQARLVSAEQALPSTQRTFSRVIWGMFTGNYPYQRIMGMALTPRALTKLAWNLIKVKVGQRR